MDRVEQATSTRSDRVDTVRKAELLDDIHTESEDDPIPERGGGSSASNLKFTLDVYDTDEGEIVSVDLRKF